MKKASIFVMIATVASKLIGFVRDTFLARLYGDGPVASAFVYAYSLPSQVFSVVVAAFVTGFIPMFTRIEQEEGTDRANLFTSNIMNVMFMIALVVSSLIFFFTKPVVGFLLPNAKPDVLVYIIPFLKVSIFSLMFTCIVQIMTGFLQVRKAYVIPMLMGFPLNFALIGAMYLSKSLGEQWLSYGILSAYVIQAFLILGFAWFKGFKYSLHIDLKDKHMRRMLYLAVPLIIGSASATIGNMFNQSIVSGFDGGLALLNYSSRVGNIVESIFALSITSVMYPSISKAIAMGRKNEAQDEFSKSLVSMLVFVIPSAIGLFLLAKPIIIFIYYKGVFTMDSVNALTPVLRNYSLAIISVTIYNLCIKVFYSFQDNKTPMFLSMTVITIQITMNYILSSFLGVPGVTLAIAIAYFIGVGLVSWRLSYKFTNFKVKRFARQILKVFFAGAVMGLVVFVVFGVMNSRFGNTLSLLVTIVIAIIVYGTTVLFLRVEAVEDLLGGIRRKLRR